MDYYTGPKVITLKTHVDMTCLRCPHFEESAPYSYISTHAYCKHYGHWITCFRVEKGLGYKGTDQLPIKLAKCLNEFTGPITKRERANA